MSNITIRRYYLPDKSFQEKAVLTVLQKKSELNLLNTSNSDAWKELEKSKDNIVYGQFKQDESGQKIH